MGSLILTQLVFLPLAAALLTLVIPKDRENWIRAVALLATGLVLVLATLLVFSYHPLLAGFQFEEKISWIPQVNVWYHLGVDGISLPLVFLTALISFVGVIASASIQDRLKEYFFLYLLLVTGMMGTFLALDLFLFYIFWEIVLVPMYFLIGIWGGPRREYAAIKFFLYTLAGSVFMLLAIIVCYFSSLPHSFSIPELAQQGLRLSQGMQWAVFMGFFLAFAIKVPIFPFHTWLPDAHVEAPTPISVILAGVLLKMGGYGFFRISLPLLPGIATQFAVVFVILGVINIIYGAMVALAQTDFKKLVAYSSVSHMGFVLLGLGAMNLPGFNGAALEMFNHGMITGGMFLLVGVLYDRTHTRNLADFGGLGAKVPVYSGLLIFFSMASLGLPALSGFVGEFLSLMGGFLSFPGITLVSVFGLVVGAAVFLLLIQKVLLGVFQTKWAHLRDINTRELLAIAPLMAMVLWVGLFPRTILFWQSTTLGNLLRHLGSMKGW